MTDFLPAPGRSPIYTTGLSPSLAALFGGATPAVPGGAAMLTGPQPAEGPTLATILGVAPSTIPGGPAMLTGSQGPITHGEKHVPGGPAMLSSGPTTAAAPAASKPAAAAKPNTPGMNAAAYAAMAGGMEGALSKMGQSAEVPSGPDAQTLAAMFSQPGAQIHDTSPNGRMLAHGIAEGARPGSLSDLFGQLDQQQQALAYARLPQTPVGAYPGQIPQR